MQFRVLLMMALTKARATIEGVRQYAIEASIAKVFGSEALDYVVDEGVQIYGGMGYSSETIVERAYRDSRINRIFEGTNEINRLLAVGELVKRGMKGEFDLLTPAKSVAKELLAIPDFGSPSQDYFELKHKYLLNYKKTILLVAGAALKKYMDKFPNEQEIIMNLADMLIVTYAAESLLLRVEKLALVHNHKNIELYKDILDIYLYDTAPQIHKWGIDAINAFATGDELMGMQMGIKRFTKTAGVNVVEKRRNIANHMILLNTYNL